MILLKAGRIAKLSTNYELEQRFGIRQKRLTSCLNRALSEEERKARLALIKHHARSSLDAIEAQRIMAYLIDEVATFREEGTGRISYRDELTEKFGVSRKALETSALKRLKPELRQARKKILRSQITRDRNASYWGRRKNTRAKKQ